MIFGDGNDKNKIGIESLKREKEEKMLRKIQLGVALTAEVMAKMKASERRFWEKFLSRAQKEIVSADDNSNQFPIEPSEILKKQHAKAVKKYDGEKYCQMRQLQLYFKF